jgi:hypothetical protein
MTILQQVTILLAAVVKYVLQNLQFIGRQILSTGYKSII